MSRFPITAKGLAKVHEELKHLKFVERPAIISEIQRAREFGDLSENAEYSSAREKQGHIEGRISKLEDLAARADIIDISSLSGDVVKFGAKIKLVDEDSGDEADYQIVGEYEADLKHQLISITSPLARSLIGKTVGDYVEVATPKYNKAYTILKVWFE